MDVLEKFLTAKSLAEREPLIELTNPKEDLSITCLAGPLPPARSMTPEFRESNHVEGVMDYYHRVDFGADDAHPNPHFILVRARGKAAPKVVVEPFLDLYGGRLAAYASKPTEKAAYFQVIVYPLPTCTDNTIPDYEKKQTLRLLASDNGKEIAKAYFGKQSKIAGMLEDGSHDLSYGNAKACTVMLHWNTQDKPDRPYLEAGNIKALDWNP